MRRKILLSFLLMFLLFLIACKKDDNKDDRIVITYAAWNLGTINDNGIERQMIAKFMEKYPNIRVDIIERPTKVDTEGNEIDVSWDEFFATQSAVGKMPDVFQSASVINSVLNGWAENIYDVAYADSEFLEIPEDIRSAALLNNKLYALPQALFYIGYFINRTAIDKTGAGAIVPEYGITYDDLMHAASVDYKLPVDGGDGIASINGVEELMAWLPAQYDSSLGWFTYNEEGFHFDSPHFQTAVNEQRKYYQNANLYANYVLESLEVISNESQNADLYYGTGNPFENGKQTIRFAPSYNMRNWVLYTQTETHPLFNNDIDFIGTPSVMVGEDLIHRIPIVLDFLGVGRGTKHIEEAYLFAKWMGFGIDGYKMRLEIAENDPLAGAVNFAPIIPNQVLLDEYFSLYPTMTEYRKIVENHRDFIVESLAKTVPGYINVRWEGQYNTELNMWAVFNQISKGLDEGSIDLATALQQNLNGLANQMWLEAKTQLDEATK